MALKTGLAQFEALGKTSNSFASDSLRALTGKLISAKIRNINQVKGAQNGIAEVEILDEIVLGGSKIVSNVYPLLPNIKNYPLVNEVVLIIALANKEYANNFNSLTFYYLTPLNLWNTNHVNPIPSRLKPITPSTQNKSYQEVELVGTPNKPSSGSNTDFKVGTYFVEKGDINPLYPYEGDVILDGRFGNSIRLGNTVPNGSTFVENNWSSTGSIGDPITIISNNRHYEEPSYDSITEDINKDKSSVYLTSTQKVPLEVSSTNDYLSYDGSESPTLPSQYNKNQIIINSGRLVFNASADHILLASAKSINLNSQKSINFDTLGPIVLEAPEIKIGSSLATESAILGDTLIETLQGITTNLRNALLNASTQLGNNGVPLEPLGSAFRNAANSLDVYRNELDKAKSNIVKIE